MFNDFRSWSRSLTHSVLTRPDRRILTALGIKPISITESVLHIVESKQKLVPRAYRSAKTFIKQSTVRSIQRFGPFTAEEIATLRPIAERYFTWLPKFLLGIVRVQKSQLETKVRVTFILRFFSLRLLVLEHQNTAQAGSIGTELISIVDGLLKGPVSGGSLEFRVIQSESVILAIVRDFVPRLPWTVYRFTQAKIHVWVMQKFGKALLEEKNNDKNLVNSLPLNHPPLM